MKTNEHFDLPVASGKKPYNSDDIFQVGGNGVWCATFCSNEQAKVAANCINHADALADALEALLPNIDTHRELAVPAAKALAAYRGAK